MYVCVFLCVNTCSVQRCGCINLQLLSCLVHFCSIDYSLVTFNWFHTVFVDNMPIDVSQGERRRRRGRRGGGGGEEEGEGRRVIVHIR